MIFCAWVQLGFLSPCDSSLSPNNIWKSMFKEPILEIARSNNVSENPHDWFSGNGPGRFWSPVDSPSWKVSGCCPGLDRAQESTGGRPGNTATRSTNQKAAFGHLISSTNERPVRAGQWGGRWSGVNITAGRDSRRRKLQFLWFRWLC